MPNENKNPKIVFSGGSGRFGKVLKKLRVVMMYYIQEKMNLISKI